MPRLSGIRFRLALALAFALLPILALGAFQAQGGFQAQETERRTDLQLEARRTAASAKMRLDDTAVLLDRLSVEISAADCQPRLTALIERLETLDGLARLGPSGAAVCVSERLDARNASWMQMPQDTPWFARLRNGERAVLFRSIARPDRTEGLIVARRLQTASGQFNGVFLAVVPLATLQPDISNSGLPAGSHAALTDAKGLILTTTNPDAFAMTGNENVMGWVERARADGSAMFDADDQTGRHRIFASAALANRDIYALLSAPSPGLLSWARLNPVAVLLMPLFAWLVAFVAVMWVSERLVVRWLAYLERIAAIYARGRFSVRPLHAVAAPYEIRVLAGTLDDLAETITARDKALQASLGEKDALMREIHHRVKNNLQIISSLLSMQQRTLTDPGARAAIGDTRQRISALALIYRTLYQSDDLRFADAKVFLNELVGQLVAGEAMRGPLVTSSVEADTLVVDPDKLAPLALWLVEAVSNAQKHAFAGRGGDLQVRFRVDGDRSTLEVQDDGPGVSDQVRDGVGRTLMGAFAKQLRGEVTMTPAPGGGTIARMTFATPEALTPIHPEDVGTSTGRRR